MMTLMDEQLFEWDVKPPRQKFKPTVELVPRPPGYHLISNRSGVQGFHRTKVTADMAAYSTVLTFCGIYGRRVKDVFPDRIPLCEGCERALREEA